MKPIGGVNAREFRFEAETKRRHKQMDIKRSIVEKAKKK
jgi:hypothetical protein